MKYNIDAKEKPIGRVASLCAKLLRGKELVNFHNNVVPDVKVFIKNASHVKISPSRMAGKTYLRHSQYPGGLKRTKLMEELKSKGYSEVMRHAISGMLPKNRLRRRFMRNLTIEE